MPYHIQKTDGKFEVMNIKSGRTHGKTTKAKAERQMRLLRAIEHGFKPTGKKSKK